MTAKLRTTMRADILTDLSGVADTEWTDTELNRAIEKATADLSRFLPRQMLWEKTLDLDEVTDEQVTLTAHGTYKEFANKPIKFGSERICDDASETTRYTRDTDYTIDYINGEITSISGGSIGATATIYCNYTISKIMVYIGHATTGIMDALIRIDRVEYPVGDVPQSYPSWGIWGDYLIIEGLGDSSQQPLSDSQHLVVYYHGVHTPPTDSVAGTYPIFLENTVILAASAYALFHKAVEAEHQAVDNMNHVVTAALKMATYLDNNSEEDAVGILKDITDATSELRQAIGAALVCQDNYLDEVDSTDLQGAEAVWADEEKHIRGGITAGSDTTGTAFKLTDSTKTFTTADVGKIIHNLTDDTWTYAVALDSTTVLSIAEDIMDNTELYAMYHANMQAYIADASYYVNRITTGQNVPERFTALAQIATLQQTAWRQKRQDWIAQATARTSAAIGYIQGANARLANLRTYIEEAGMWTNIARGFSDQAGQFLSVVQAYLLLAQQYRTEAIERRSEAWAIWRDPKQYTGDFTYTALRQPGNYK